jgi:hypothetical protein
MKKISSILIFCVLWLPGFAQVRTVDVGKEDVNVGNLFYAVSGQPFVNARFVRLVEGSPYFKDEWMKGTIIVEKGQQYKGRLKLDLFDNEVHYLDDKDNEIIVTMPIRQVILTDNTTTYSFLNSLALPKSTKPFAARWFQQLYSDSIVLYKYFRKKVSESKPFNSATYEQRISTSDVYLVYYDNNFIEVKKVKDAPALFGEEKAALEEFLNKEDDKNTSLDERMIAFVAKLNALTKN